MGWMVNRDKEVVCLRLRVSDNLPVVLDRGSRYSRQAGFPLIHGLGEKYLLQNVKQGNPILPSDLE